MPYILLGMDCYYLITPTSTLKHFVLASDREYFSRPVRVINPHSELCDIRRARQPIVRVTDPARGVTFSAFWSSIVSADRLTRRQRVAAGLP